MKPIRDIIVKVPKAYKTNITLKSGLVLFFDENIKQVKDTIRYGEVVCTPDGCELDVAVGDTLFFHHGIVAVTTLDGRPEIQSMHLVDEKEGLYKVPIDKRWPVAYATIRDGEFKPLDGICFVRKQVDKKYDTQIYIPNNEKEKLNVGEMVYPDSKQIKNGITEGTKVVFSKNSEYQFNVGEENLYCMFTKWIIGIYED